MVAFPIYAENCDICDTSQASSKIHFYDDFASGWCFSAIVWYYWMALYAGYLIFDKNRTEILILETKMAKTPIFRKVQNRLKFPENSFQIAQKYYCWSKLMETL